MTAFQEFQTTWCRQLIHSLALSGVELFVVSPGSRSTPLVTAIQAHPSARILSVVDERAAAFYALGRAKVTGLPCAVVCTSGSAPTHYFPAVVEASQSHTPIVLLTADRPPELQGNGAPQTVDQRLLFGRHVRLDLDLQLPSASPSALQGVSRKAAQAVASSLGPVPGPAVLNCPFRKPLEPSTSATALRAPTLHMQGPSRATEQQLTRLAHLIGNRQRPVLEMGPCSPARSLAPEVVDRFCRETGFVLVAESPSQSRHGLTHSTPRWGSFEICAALGLSKEMTPDFILQLGPPLTAGRWQRATDNVPRLVIGSQGWPDPSNAALAILNAEPEDALDRLTPLLKRDGAHWCRSVECTDRAATSALAQHADGGGPNAWGDQQAISIVGRHLRRGDLLVVANSLAVRLVDQLIPPLPWGLPCVSQRGANGIDGQLASALGAASAHPGRTLLLTGDITFWHDLSSLALLADAKDNLCVVVINNGGGRLFELLPLAEAGERDLGPWTTPHGQRLSNLAKACRIPSTLVEDADQLRKTLAADANARSVRLVEVLVPADGAKRGARQIEKALSDALGSASLGPQSNN